MRGFVDEQRPAGRKTGNFLILGSAAINLLQQSGEILAGRIEYIHMNPLNVLEIFSTDQRDVSKLWLRGGLPQSFLCDNDEDSFILRRSFIRAYLERDAPLFGTRIPAETLERFWTMLGHNQGCLLNASHLGRNLAVSAPTITSYIDLLVDLLLVRRLKPFHINISKRLVKLPKTYIRDSGLLHALLGIQGMNDLLSNPIVGGSWEGFVIESLLSVSPQRTQASFYRTLKGAEVDLLLELGGKHGMWSIEVKRSLSPKVEKGYNVALDDLKPNKSFIVYAGDDRYMLKKNVEAISLGELKSEIANIK